VPILNLSSSIALKLLPSTRAAMAALAGDGIQSTPIPIGRFDPPPTRVHREQSVRLS
jgi:hypothetical protein